MEYKLQSWMPQARIEEECRLMENQPTYLEETVSMSSETSKEFGS